MTRTSDLGPVDSLLEQTQTTSGIVVLACKTLVAQTLQWLHTIGARYCVQYLQMDLLTVANKYMKN